MRTFTPTEIDLCKKIAEKERKKQISYGDWYYDLSKQQIELWWSFEQDAIDTDSTMIPLWQEHDCLERLDKTKDITLRICSHPDAHLAEVEHDDKIYCGATPLEALLRAVLAVMEGK